MERGGDRRGGERTEESVPIVPVLRNDHWVARKRSGYGAGLAINRSPVRFTAAALSRSDPGQVVHIRAQRLSSYTCIWRYRNSTLI